MRAGRWWVVLGLVAILVVAGLSAFLTAPRPGGLMDPAATGPDGTHALVTLLRERGVAVTVAQSVTDAEHATQPGTLLLVAQTARIADTELLQRLSRLQADLLLVAPEARAREALAPDVRAGKPTMFISQPDCDLTEAQRAGSVDLGTASTYVAAEGQSVISCYDGALVRYRAGQHTITVVGSASFMTNGDLARGGNAALAMNLTGARGHLVWYAPQHVEGGRSATATVFDLIPPNVNWLFWQLFLALIVAAIWQGRRLGPLVAERLPVVVRASETVEGRGRLYRSHRAGARAADALRTAARQRLSARLGLGAAAPPPVVVAAVGQRTGAPVDQLWHLLFGPPPESDTDLVSLSRQLDDLEGELERQVRNS